MNALSSVVKPFFHAVATLFLACTFVFAAHSEDLSSVYYNLGALPGEVQNGMKWKLQTEGLYNKENLEETLAAVSKLKLKGTYRLSPSVFFYGSGRLRLASQRAQRVFDDNFGGNSVAADELTMNFNLGSSFLFSAGNQFLFDVGSPLIFGRRSFPGLKQRAHFDLGDWSLGAMTQQLIPTSSSFAVDRTEQEKLPTLLTAQLFADYNLNLKSSLLGDGELNLSSTLGYYQYSNLPSVTADEGQLLGHFIIGDEATARYRYDFAGYFFVPSIEWVHSDKHSIRLKGEWADNLKIKNSKNNDRAQGIGARASYVYGPNTYYFEVENYFKDSEVSPAVYNTGRRGGNNLRGNKLLFGIGFNKYKFRIEGEFYDTQPIVQNNVQFDRNFFLVKVETFYVSF